MLFDETVGAKQNTVIKSFVKCCVSDDFRPILARLSAKAAVELAKRARLSIKRAIRDTKHTIPLETVSKSSAGTSKTHETVNKKSDRRRKTYDSVRDCQQKQRGN